MTLLFFHSTTEGNTTDHYGGRVSVFVLLPRCDPAQQVPEPMYVDVLYNAHPSRCTRIYETVHGTWKFLNFYHFMLPFLSVLNPHTIFLFI
jgi:hypothetical protein